MLRPGSIAVSMATMASCRDRPKGYDPRNHQDPLFHAPLHHYPGVQ